MASGSKRVVYAALFGNGVIAVTKFVAAAMTGSSAMLAEGVHSVADTGNQAFMLLGLKRGARPSDRTHPFGYGKEVFFWGFVVAIVLFAVGAGVSVYEGVTHLFHPADLRDPLPNYIVLGIAAAFETGATSVAVRELLRRKGERGVLEALKESKDPSLFVVLFEDMAALAGIAVAAVGVYLSSATGDPVWDAGASIVIGLILAAISLWLAWETRGLLVGEAARTPLLEGVREIVQGHRTVERVGKLLTMHMGPEKVLVVLSVDFASDASSAAIESAAGELERTIRDEHPTVRWVFVEGESLERR